MLQAIAMGEVLACYILWALAFAAARKRTTGQQKVVRAASSRLGMVLQGVGFAFVWVYVRPRSRNAFRRPFAPTTRESGLTSRSSDDAPGAAVNEHSPQRMWAYAKKSCNAV